MKSLSVIVITKNEANNIEDCLRSVLFADQLLVLDSGSTDETQQLARNMGAEVSEDRDWQGFGIQKNRALALTRCDWVLSIDADERVSSSLRAEILQVLEKPSKEVYTLSRLSSYCGQYIMHSGWNPDHVVRLFKRDAATFSNELVHEKLETDRPIGALTAPLLHESFQNFEAVLDKANRYSTAGAKMLFAKGQSASLGKAVAHGVWAFVRTYLIRRGFLDGRMGFVLAVSNAEGTYYRYLKLWLMATQTSHGQKAAASSASGASTR